MTFIEFVTSYLNLALFTRIAERRTPIHSPIYEHCFPTRTPRAVSRINLTDLKRAIHSMPVITRGGMAIPLDAKEGTSVLIEPLSIRLSDFITGAKLNDLKALFGDGSESGQALVKTEIDKIIEDLLRSTEATRNALCAQAMTGKISYQLESQGKKERYEITFGTTLKADPATKLDTAGQTLVDLYNVLSSMKRKIADKGYAGTVEVMAGANAFSLIANLIMASKDTDRMGAMIRNDRIEFMGFNIWLNDATYTDTSSDGKSMVKQEVDTNSIMMYVTALGEVQYCAVDDVNANLQATPFWANAYTNIDPSGYKIISESKPMPMMPAESICWATITTGPSIKAGA